MAPGREEGEAKRGATRQELVRKILLMNGENGMSANASYVKQRHEDTVGRVMSEFAKSGAVRSGFVTLFVLFHLTGVGINSPGIFWTYRLRQFSNDLRPNKWSKIWEIN